MQVSDFSYHLPEHLIAQHPLENRTDSRLMQVNVPRLGQITHGQFSQFEALLQPNDLLVFNNTRVIPARMHGKKATGGAVELLVERLTGVQTALVMLRSSKSPKAGAILTMDGDVQVRIDGREGQFFCVTFLGDTPALMQLEAHGHMPLPPYIERSDEEEDKERYQTVFSSTPGAVAAPTAGLHFDDALLANIQAKGVDTAYVTLHVGAGTFQPVRVDDITQHVMHSEWLNVPEETCQKIAVTKAKGGRVIAVGTTVVRSLESAAVSGELVPFSGETRLFLTPGRPFHVVDGLLTNFHLPESTLLMLVSAFAGMDTVKQAYQQAVQESYRFFSYGDAMFVLPDRSGWKSL